MKTALFALDFHRLILICTLPEMKFHGSSWHLEERLAMMHTSAIYICNCNFVALPQKGQVDSPLHHQLACGLWQGVPSQVSS